MDLYTDSLLIPKDTVSSSDIKISTSDSVFFNGKIFSSFFTTCAGICPRMNFNMESVQDTFLNDNAFNYYRLV